MGVTIYIYNKVYRTRAVDINQPPELFSRFNENFSQKYLVVQKKVVPLHPLSRFLSVEVDEERVL